MATLDKITYTGQKFTFWDGTICEIVSVKESEPDGYGGFLLDVTVRHQKGHLDTFHNIRSNVLEGWISELTD